MALLLGFRIGHVYRLVRASHDHHAVGNGPGFPGRVVGAGGIFLEYDGRQVPDVGTIVSDFHEGVQGIVTATMCSAETPLRQLIRGHHGSAVFGNGEDFTGSTCRGAAAGDREQHDRR